MITTRTKVVYYGIVREGKQKYSEVCITREDGVQTSCVRTGRWWKTMAEAAIANEEINRPLAKGAQAIARML